MDSAARAADIQARCARMLAEIAAMQEENRERAYREKGALHAGEDFRALADKFGLGHNEVHALLYEGGT